MGRVGVENTGSKTPDIEQPNSLDISPEKTVTSEPPVYSHQHENGDVVSGTAEQAIRECTALGNMSLKQAGLLLELEAMGKEKLAEQTKETPKLPKSEKVVDKLLKAKPEPKTKQTARIDAVQADVAHKQSERVKPIVVEMVKELPAKQQATERSQLIAQQAHVAHENAKKLVVQEKPQAELPNFPPIKPTEFVRVEMPATPPKIEPAKSNLPDLEPVISEQSPELVAVEPESNDSAEMYSSEIQEYGVDEPQVATTDYLTPENVLDLPIPAEFFVDDSHDNFAFDLLISDESPDIFEAQFVYEETIEPEVKTEIAEIFEQLSDKISELPADTAEPIHALADKLVEAVQQILILETEPENTTEITEQKVVLRDMVIELFAYAQIECDDIRAEQIITLLLTNTSVDEIKNISLFRDDGMHEGLRYIFSSLQKLKSQISPHALIGKYAIAFASPIQFTNLVAA